MVLLLPLYRFSLCFCSENLKALKSFYVFSMALEGRGMLEQLR